MVNKDLDFDTGSDVKFVAGCGVTLRDQFMYFGGKDDYKKQVSL